jgi:transcription elongation factor Elf1
MADFVDVQYVSLLAGQLQKYVVKHRNPFKANFRCVICGDSQKSQTKARAWIIESPKTGAFQYHCFNCGASQGFGSFLKANFLPMYANYIAEKYISKSKDKPSTHSIDECAKTPKPKFNRNPLSSIKKVSQLKSDHPVKLYIQKRQIPSHQHHRLYYAPKFKTWINTILPNKFEHVDKDEPRLVMPLFSKEGKVFGVSARSFDPKSNLRYITIMFEEVPKIFGLDKVNFNKNYFITEGALDSMFLTNALAMVGADTNVYGLEQIENATFVHDAEPRNLQICNRMEKLLTMGHKVCIWPSSVPAKDINDMHLNGMQDIEGVIKSNTYSGLEGQLRFRTWKKC